MDWFVQKYLQACLVWFGVGVTLGLAMAVVGNPSCRSCHSRTERATGLPISTSP